MLLFNTLIRGIMPAIQLTKMKTVMMLHWKDKVNLVGIMILSDNLFLFLQGHCSSSVRAQWIMDPWKSSWQSDHYHNSRWYKIHVTKTGWPITRTGRHVRMMSINTQYYLRDKNPEDRKTDTLEGLLKYYEQQMHICSKIHSNTQEDYHKHMQWHLNVE